MEEETQEVDIVNSFMNGTSDEVGWAFLVDQELSKESLSLLALKYCSHQTQKALAEKLGIDERTFRSRCKDARGELNIHIKSRWLEQYRQKVKKSKVTVPTMDGQIKVAKRTVYG